MKREFITMDECITRERRSPGGTVSRLCGTSSSTASVPETEEPSPAVFAPRPADSRWFRVRRVAIAFAGLLVGCTALWVAMRNVRWSDVVTLAAGGDLRLALIGTFLYIFTSSTRSRALADNSIGPNLGWCCSRQRSFGPASYPAKLAHYQIKD
jgi:hypothetical protein